MKRFLFSRPRRIFCAVCGLALTSRLALSESATWNADPISDDWNTAENWSPASIPNGPSDTASFASSSQTNIALSAPTEVAEMSFPPGASPYSFKIGPNELLTVSGAGILNGAAVEQSFVLTTDVSGDYGQLAFRNAANAGDKVSYVIEGARSATDQTGAQLVFHDDSSAGTAAFSTFGGSSENARSGMIIFHGSSTAGAGSFVNHATTVNAGGGKMCFYDDATAGSAMVINKAIPGNEGVPGTTDFLGHSNAGDATFINEATTVIGGYRSGTTYFQVNSSAGDATIVLNGSRVVGGEPGRLEFSGNASAGNATIISYPAARETLGGLVVFFDNSDGGTARIKLLGASTRLDLAEHFRSLSLGSIEGNGQVLMGGSVSVGKNNEDTVFSGVIIGLVGNNVLTKVGAGQLTLAEANRYTQYDIHMPGTIVAEGTLLATNRRGSATGPGLVLVRGGKLSGTGTISGAVRVLSVISAGMALRLAPLSRSGATSILRAPAFTSLS